MTAKITNKIIYERNLYIFFRNSSFFPQECPEIAFAHRHFLANAIKRELVTRAVFLCIETVMRADGGISVGQAQQAYEPHGGIKLPLAHRFLVEVALEAYADGILVVSIDMGSHHIARPSLIDFAVLADEIMIAYSGPAFCLMPPVHILNRVRTRHLRMVNDDIICPFAPLKLFGELQVKLMNHDAVK